MSLSPQSRTYRFLSTLSLRRATRGNLPGWSRWSYFYPRSPCGERHLVLHGTARNADISIHALLAESDSARVVTSFWFILFLSTLSLRRATLRPGEHYQRGQDFYPRSPCGERPLYITAMRTANLFLSTLSLRRATLMPMDMNL